MSELPPGAVPAELFCVAGWTSKAVLEHEEYLFQQHEAGAVQLYDRGRITGDGPPLRRWRMSWHRGNEVVYAAVVMFEGEDAATLWFVVYCDLGRGWSVPHPLDRVGLHRYPIVDPASGLLTTGSRTAERPEEIIVVAQDLPPPAVRGHRVPPLPLISFCATGYAEESGYEHERVLIKLHYAGKLRLIDGGWESESGDGIRRWRMSWGTGSAAVRAILGVTMLDDGRATLWVYAEANRPWSIRDQENPVQRMGLQGQGLVDPSAGFAELLRTAERELAGLRFGHRTGIRPNWTIAGDHASG